MLRHGEEFVTHVGLKDGFLGLEVKMEGERHLFDEGRKVLEVIEERGFAPNSKDGSEFLASGARQVKVQDRGAIGLNILSFLDVLEQVLTLKPFLQL